MADVITRQYEDKSNSMQKPINGSLLDLRRKAQIVRGKPNDHTGEIVSMPMGDRFDINSTIFKTLDEAFVPAITKQYAVELFWSDRTVDQIEKETTAMLQAPGSKWADIKAHSPELLSFMQNDCDFDCEHAEGSFLDHLQFCYEYSCVHFPTHSAMPIFLHSIMGVGTNLFPMQLEQKADLAKLVTAEDLSHIEAFPTVLRLLATDLTDELVAMSPEELGNIAGLDYCRLLGPNMDNLMKSDNVVCSLNAEQFWVHLNYQLIHMLDFLPPDNFDENIERFAGFMNLHLILTRANKLMCKIDFDSEAWQKKFAIAMQDAPDNATFSMLAHFSTRIEHSLDYTIKVHEPVAALARARL